MTPPPLALTMGEPAGIGGEIAIKTWRSGDAPAFFLLDDPDRISDLAQTLGLDVPVRAVASPAEAAVVFAGALPVLPQALPNPVRPGEPDPANGGAVMAAIQHAVALVRGGHASAVVTNPIHKKTLCDSGFRFPGHTEYLADLCGGGVRPVMMLACSGLRAVPITVHHSLRAAIDGLSRELIVDTGVTVAEALRRDFAIAEPRLAIAGLNPHAGEDGAMGGEDGEIVAPAVAELRARGIDASGPRPADTLFHPRARETYDAALCMYHDQALIPIKTIDFDGGVNITLGLPIVRTSPDHGTAFGIAGTGEARETSLLAALTMAAEMAARRAEAES